MKLRHKNNGGLAQVSDEYGKRLIASGSWEAADAPKPAAPKAAQRPAKKAAQKPTEAPEAE